MAACSERFPCGDDFDAVLAIFCSYHYAATASETVEKKAIEKKNMTNTPCALQHINKSKNRRDCLRRTPPA